MSVDIKAVDSNPMTWVVWCDICDKAVTEPTTNDELLDAQELEHSKTHNLI